MVGVVYIKIFMIIFIAVPLVSYLLGASGLISVLCYFVPSSASFEGIMSLADSDKPMITKDIFILMAHCIIWFALYLSTSGVSPVSIPPPGSSQINLLKRFVCTIGTLYHLVCALSVNFQMADKTLFQDNKTKGN